MVLSGALCLSHISQNKAVLDVPLCSKQSNAVIQLICQRLDVGDEYYRDRYLSLASQWAEPDPFLPTTFPCRPLGAWQPPCYGWALRHSSD